MTRTHTDTEYTTVNYARLPVLAPLLSLVDPVDDTYRRRMNSQLTVQESRLL